MQLATEVLSYTEQPNGLIEAKLDNGLTRRFKTVEQLLRFIKRLNVRKNNVAI